MAVCYFNRNYEEKYNCEYEVKNDGIEIEVDYNIDNEIPITNGIRTYTKDTKFKERDILIIDHKTKMNYLLKKAHYCGRIEVLGTPDNGSTTKFLSRNYFYDKNYEKLLNMTKTSKIKEIVIYSDIINEFIGCPSLIQQEGKNEYTIKLKKDTEKQVITINKNNIKDLIISDDWETKYKNNSKQIDINLKGYIKIELIKSISYEDVYDYIQELMIYFQLLRPDKFNINKILVRINKKYYGLSIYMINIEYSKFYVESSINDKLSQFLQKCYNLIPYRNSKNEIKNIPYIVLYTSRNVEDNFLMFYRFIECYYKKQPIKNIKTSFIEHSIKNNYHEQSMSERLINKLAYEMISLRNHYVHEGYYIKDENLYISFPKIDGKANPKNFMAKKVNIEWIYKRTKILYKIVIDIIFKEMLNYEKYKFNKHF